jgi:multicomponent Na+:H+ antiporter subunit D
MAGIDYTAGLIVTPLSAAIVAFLLGRRIGRDVAFLTSVSVAWMTIGLTLQIFHSGPVRYEVGGWGAPLGIDLYADGITALMLIMTVIVGVGVTIYSRGYFSTAVDEPPSASNTARNEHARQDESFWPLWLLLWAALNALFLSGDIFNIYVTLELLTLAAVALIGLAGTNEALKAALRYLLVTLAGSLFYLLGVALVYSNYGTVDWTLLAGAARPDVVTRCAVALMSAGLLLKTALFPVHFWLPPAHANAPAPASALLSGLVLKGSYFVLLRLWLVVFPAAITPIAGQLLGALGGAAILWGALQAIRQRRLKLMIAYSTVAQIGYLFLVFALAMEPSVSLAAWSGAAYFALSHAVAKAAAFMAAGSLMYATGSDELDRLEGIADQQPVLIFAFGLAGVSLMGLPPSGGFIAKWMLLDAALKSQRWELAAVMLVGGLLTAVYVFRVIGTSFLGESSVVQSRRVPLVMRWTPLVLALVSIALGFMAMQPMELLRIGAWVPAASVTEANP